MTDDNEYLDMNYFLYTSVIVKYVNNYPQIIACCENILNGAYIIDTYQPSLKNNKNNKNNKKYKMICVNNEDIDTYPIEDIDIYNSDCVFVKDILISEYIDLKDLWEQTDRFVYIIYKINNNNIIPIMVSEKKDIIMKQFELLRDAYLVYIRTNTYYESHYKMEQFIYTI